MKRARGRGGRTPSARHMIFGSRRYAWRCYLAWPQAAVVGVVVTDRFEIFFDTFDSTRKSRYLRANPRVAFVLGGMTAGDERTVQCEGVVDQPSGPDLERLQALYFERFPEGRDRRLEPGLIYLRARPVWIRYSDYSRVPPEIAEFRWE